MRSFDQHKTYSYGHSLLVIESKIFPHTTYFMCLTLNLEKVYAGLLGARVFIHE